MPLDIETFSNAVGGNAFYKAVTHPLAAEPARALVDRLRGSGPVAIYDPHGLLAAFDAVFPLEGLKIAGVFVQDLKDVGRLFRGHAARPVTELKACRCRSVLVAAFDAAAAGSHLKLFMPEGASLAAFDAFRLPDDMLSEKGRYLSNLNFATNFAFFRDEGGQHTRLVTINYWGGYGSKGGFIWFALFGSDGQRLAEWKEALPEANASIVVDSADVSARYKLASFTGQLFMHVVGAAGHEIVKYALDTYGDAPEMLSCTHDANSWPADRYRSTVLPTPMSTAQNHLPTKIVIYDKDGCHAAEQSFGNVSRKESVALAANELLNGLLPGNYGHMELSYDFGAGREADGWLHALFRYEDIETGHAAETSFGAHVFNTLVTYKGEPQSYKGPPPGLSTRLFLRVGPAPFDTMCHLVYPASRPWHETSDTALMLMSSQGQEVARRNLRIPCGGSTRWRPSD